MPDHRHGRDAHIPQDVWPTRPTGLVTHIRGEMSHRSTRSLGRWTRPAGTRPGRCSQRPLILSSTACAPSARRTAANGPSTSKVYGSGHRDGMGRLRRRGRPTVAPRPDVSASAVADGHAPTRRGARPLACAAVPRRYEVRTYGCQMNEHDSERIAGLLEADGLVRAEPGEPAHVVVLNTCCIRENADNKLYGNLGHLRPWKDAREGRQIVVSGCLAQKDREIVATKARHVDVVMGTHNVHRAAELLREAHGRSRPLVEILEEAVIDDHAMFPSALPARRETTYNAW